jgi:hypothetical protein
MADLSVFFLAAVASTAAAALTIAFIAAFINQRVDDFTSRGRYTYVFENGRWVVLRSKTAKEMLQSYIIY